MHESFKQSPDNTPEDLEQSVDRLASAKIGQAAIHPSEQFDRLTLSSPETRIEAGKEGYRKVTIELLTIRQLYYQDKTAPTDKLPSSIKQQASALSRIQRIALDSVRECNFRPVFSEDGLVIDPTYLDEYKDTLAKLEEARAENEKWGLVTAHDIESTAANYEEPDPSEYLGSLAEDTRRYDNDYRSPLNDQDFQIFHQQAYLNFRQHEEEYGLEARYKIQQAEQLSRDKYRENLASH